MIARRAFGGSIETQAMVGMLVVLTTVSISLAYYNIKKLQIEQHRAWMLRTMFYMGTIITLRLIMIISAMIVTQIGGFYQIKTCGQLAFIQESSSSSKIFYPECVNATSTKPVVVDANFGDRPDQIGASLGVSFGMAGWVALLTHLVGVEIYLALTPRESERLRKVSYERQLEAGFKNPGRAGLTSDRIGDAYEWQPRSIDDADSGLK